MPDGDGSKIRNKSLVPCRGVNSSLVGGPHWHGSIEARRACAAYQRRDVQDMIPGFELLDKEVPHV